MTRYSVMKLLECFSQDFPDGSLATPWRTFGAKQTNEGWSFRRQSQDLVDRVAVKDEIRSDKSGPCLTELLGAYFQELTDRGVSVEAEPLCIAYGHKEEVKQDGLAGKELDKAVADKAAVDPAESIPGKNSQAR